MGKRLRVGFWMWAASLTLICAVVISCGQPTVKAAEPSLDVPVFVVSTEKLDGQPYEGAVMLAVPFGGGHAGFVLNMPTEASMGLVFHKHKASQAVVDPIYRGGFDNPDQVFALVSASKAPTPKAIAMLPGVWLVMNSDEIDQVIEKTPNAARYYVGYVGWRPGMLAGEVERGVVVLRPLDSTKLFLKDTSGLYPRLAPRSGKLKEV